jgi:uncharacterized protein involved in exopolysaccharide biosynthesis
MIASETPNTTLRVFFHILFKRKILVVTFCVSVFLIVGIYLLMSQPAYRAASEILIKMGREHLFVPTTTDPGLRALSSYSSLEQINSEIEIITSPPLLKKVIASIGPAAIYPELLEKNPGLIGNFRKKLTLFSSGLREKISRLLNRSEKNIAVDSLGRSRVLSDQETAYLLASRNLGVRGIKNSRVIEITFKHKDPEMAAIVLSKFVDAYLEFRPHVHKNTETYAFFQEQSEIMRSKVRQVENELKALKEEHDIVALPEERTLLLQKKADLQAQLNASLSEKVETENRINQINKQLNSTPPKIQQGETTNLNPMLINTLEERLVTLELKEKELLTKYTDSNYLVRQVKDELKLVRQKLREHEGKRYDTASFGPNPTYTALKDSLNQNQAELEAVNGKIETQTAHLAEYTKRLDKLNQVEYKFDGLNNQLEVDKKNYHLYLTKYEEDRISNEMDTKNLANVSVVKPAQTPLKPEGPKKILIVVAALFAAVFGSIGLTLCLELLSDRLERPEDIENFLQTPVLASISEFRV